MFVNQELVEIPHKIIAWRNATATTLVRWKLLFQIPAEHFMRSASPRTHMQSLGFMRLQQSHIGRDTLCTPNTAHVMA